MKKNKSQLQSGFTLIELLVVISIIGFLASIVLVNLNGARLKARNSQRKQNLVQLQKALELYYENNGSYPSTGGAWWAETPAYGSHGLTGANGYIPNLAPTYVGSLPHDRNTGKLVSGLSSICTDTSYAAYIYGSDGVNYKLSAHCLPEGIITTTDAVVDPDRDGGPLGAGSSGCDGAGDNTNIWAWSVYSPGYRCQ